MAIRPRKKFGQHWLRNKKVLDRIILAAQISDSDRILEIGPGKGVLTEKLFAYAEKLLSVEIDRDLCKYLVNKYGDVDNFLLLEGDFLSLEIGDILKDTLPEFADYNKVVANIPYNITGPIIEKLIGTISQPASRQLDSIVLLIQKEVGERLIAVPNNKIYGALTVKVQYLADCEIVCDVPAKDFYPRPQVDSVVVKLTPKQIENPADNPKFLDTVIKLGFSSRRKMLRNNLKSIISTEQLNKILDNLNINDKARAENLSVREWIDLSNSLAPIICK